MLERVRLAFAAKRRNEEQLYQLAINEFDEGSVREGLWAQAVAHSKGNDAATKGVYLKLRVQSLRDEMEVFSAANKIDNTRPAAIETGGASERDIAIAWWFAASCAIFVILALGSTNPGPHYNDAYGPPVWYQASHFIGAPLFALVLPIPNLLFAALFDQFRNRKTLLAITRRWHIGVVVFTALGICATFINWLAIK